jgi:hypothetical protein
LHGACCAVIASAFDVRRQFVAIELFDELNCRLKWPIDICGQLWPQVAVMRSCVGRDALYPPCDSFVRQPVRAATKPPREPNARSVRLLSKRVKDLEDRIEMLQERLTAIEARLRLSAQDMCPQCRRGRLRVIETSPHPEFGFAGIELHQVRCDRAECGYAGTRLYDPNEFLR